MDRRNALDLIRAANLFGRTYLLFGPTHSFNRLSTRLYGEHSQGLPVRRLPGSVGVCWLCGQLIPNLPPPLYAFGSNHGVRGVALVKVKVVLSAVVNTIFWWSAGDHRGEIFTAHLITWIPKVSVRGKRNQREGVSCVFSRDQDKTRYFLVWIWQQHSGYSTSRVFKYKTMVQNVNKFLISDTVTNMYSYWYDGKKCRGCDVRGCYCIHTPPSLTGKSKQERRTFRQESLQTLEMLVRFINNDCWCRLSCMVN